MKPTDFFQDLLSVGFIYQLGSNFRHHFLIDESGLLAAATIKKMIV